MMPSYILCTITVNNDLAIYRNIFGIKRYNWMSGLKQHIFFKHNMSHMLHKNFPKSNSIQTSFAHHGRIKT